MYDSLRADPVRNTLVRKSHRSTSRGKQSIFTLQTETDFAKGDNLFVYTLMNMYTIEGTIQ